MYKFLLSEAWWMDTIIVSVVTAVLTSGATIVAAVIAYNYKVKELLRGVQSDLPREHDELSKEHDGLSKEHDGLSKEHDKLMEHQEKLQMRLSTELAASARASDKMSDKVNVIYTIAETERVKHDERYNALSDKDKQLHDFICDGIGAIKELQDSVQGLNLENSKLLEKVSALSTDNRELTRELAEVTVDMTALIKQNEIAVAKHNDLSVRYNALLAAQGRNQPIGYEGFDR